MYLSELRLVEAGVAILAVLLVPYILKKLLTLWRLHAAFGELPYDPDESVFVFGHGPKVHTLMRDAYMLQINATFRRFCAIPERH